MHRNQVYKDLNPNFDPPPPRKFCCSNQTPVRPIPVKPLSPPKEFQPMCLCPGHINSPNPSNNVEYYNDGTGYKDIYREIDNSTEEYNEIPLVVSSSPSGSEKYTKRSPCYRTINSRKEEDEYYKEPVKYKVTKSYQQPYYVENIEKATKLPTEVDMMGGSDRIYEIRKEKILIKADPNHSNRMRNKSSERNFETATPEEQVIEKYEKIEVPGSRSVYYIDDNKQICPEQMKKINAAFREYDQENYSAKENVNNSSNLPVNSLVNKSSNSDIIYVPMIREEFFKRELQKVETTGTNINSSILTNRF